MILNNLFQLCKDLGGYLLIINSEEEYDKVLQYITLTDGTRF